MTQTIEAAGLTFLCDDPLEVWRAQTLAEKEPGTVAWIETFQPGDVFYDIGANIGVYTLLAARQCWNGDVVAFEPHLGNAWHLLNNVKANKFQNVTVVCAPLTDGSGWEQFSYRSTRAGSSGHQLGKWTDIRELKRVVCLDDFTFEFMGLFPRHIKIDVDGLETEIVRGMERTLRTAFVQSVQVETEPQHQGWLAGFFSSLGYVLDKVHYTSNGEAAIKNGADPATVICNTIFRRK